MLKPPLRVRTRRTAGSQSLARYTESNGLRPVAVYVPIDLHRALTSSLIEMSGDEGERITLQAVITLACYRYYGETAELPPLMAPTFTKQDPHKSVTWYADIELHKKLKLLAVELDGSVQQLILSAIVEYMKEAPLVKALNLETGHSVYARAPRDTPPLPSE